MVGGSGWKWVGRSGWEEVGVWKRVDAVGGARIWPNTGARFDAAGWAELCPANS